MQEVLPKNISYDTIGELLVTQLPALRAQYDELLKWWGDEKPGPHIVYGDLLNPYIEQAIRRRVASVLRTDFFFG